LANLFFSCEPFAVAQALNCKAIDCCQLTLSNFSGEIKLESKMVIEGTEVLSVAWPLSSVIFFFTYTFSAATKM